MRCVLILLSFHYHFLVSILNYVNKWNMNSKFSEVAQAVLKVVFMTHSVEELVEIPGVKDTVEGLIPYTGV